MNSAGAQFVIIVVNQHNPNFDTPPLRAAKALTAMSLALAIALMFQRTMPKLRYQFAINCFCSVDIATKRSPCTTEEISRDFA